MWASFWLFFTRVGSWVERKVKGGIRYADILICLLSTLLIVKSGTVLEEYDKATDLVKREIVGAFKVGWRGVPSQIDTPLNSNFSN